jgi:predicted permease
MEVPMKYAAAACAILLSGLCGLLVLYWLFPALLFMTYSRKLLSWGVSLEYQFVALCFSIFLATFGSVLGAYCILVKKFGETVNRVRE